MAFNGSGTFNLVAGNPVVTGTTISSTWANNTLSDIASGLSTSVTKDGQTTPTANLPMGGFKLTGLGAGTAAGNSLRWEQLFSQGVPAPLASAATADIGAQNSVAVEISGTTTITSFGTNYNGPRFLRFTGALILTYNATTLNLPGAANITTVAGDVAIAYPNAAQNGWNVILYNRGSGIPAASGANGDITSLTALTAGGLPDNSVLTADIANAQITAAKLNGAQTGSAPIFGKRAWCKFNGTTAGTNAPTAGGNVTSVTRNGVGDYTITFTTAVPTDYELTGSAALNASGASGANRTAAPFDAATQLTTSCRILVKDDNAVASDCVYVSMSITG